MTATDPSPFLYRFIGENPALSEEFSALLSSCGFLPSSGGSAGITIVFLSPGEVLPFPVRGNPIVEWRGLNVRQDAEQILFSYQAWTLQLDLTTLTFHCAGPDPDASERRNFREFFLLSAILYMMHRLGRFELHAAACAFQESGYLLLGSSGSGKTTATLSLIESGWSYLSDDAVLVARNPDGGISARGLRRSFSLKADYLMQHPELARYASEVVPGTDKRRVDPRQIWPEQCASSTNPRFLVACSVADEERSRIVPISRAESLARLVGSTAWLMFDQETAPAHLDIFRSLAAACCSFELKAGRELFRGRECLASLIAPDVLTERWLSGTKNEIWV